MTEHDADTVTPLDGDGSNVTGVDEQFENVSQADYETRGQTTVATRRGYRFVPSDKEIPVITSAGVKVTAEQAEELVEASKNTSAAVHVVKDKED